MDLHTKYYYFKGALSDEQVNKIIQRGEEYGLQEGITFGLNHKDGEGVDESDYRRDSKISFFSDTEIFEFLWPYINNANSQAGWGWNIDCAEEFQYTTYSDGGFYDFHMDGGSDHYAKYRKYIVGLSPDPLDKNGNMPMKLDDTPWRRYTRITDHVGKIRKISVTINLTDKDEYEGGNLKFDFGNHASAPPQVECTEAREKGSIIVFPSFVPHTVTPVTKGTRKSLVMWCLGEPWK